VPSNTYDMVIGEDERCTKVRIPEPDPVVLRVTAEIAAKSRCQFVPTVRQNDELT
jgi:hypothetical protein